MKKINEIYSSCGIEDTCSFLLQIYRKMYPKYIFEYWEQRSNMNLYSKYWGILFYYLGNNISFIIKYIYGE
jgi:hypothetical protein